MGPHVHKLFHGKPIPRKRRAIVLAAKHLVPSHNVRLATPDQLEAAFLILVPAEKAPNIKLVAVPVITTSHQNVRTSA